MRNAALLRGSALFAQRAPPSGGTQLAGPVLRRRPAGNYLPARPHAREQLAALLLGDGSQPGTPPACPRPNSDRTTTHGTQGGPVAHRRGPPASGASARARSRTGATPDSGSVLSRLVLAARRALCPNRGARATHTTAHHRSTAAASRTTPGGSDHTPVGRRCPAWQRTHAHLRAGLRVCPVSARPGCPKGARSVRRAVAVVEV